MRTCPYCEHEPYATDRDRLYRCTHQFIVTSLLPDANDQRPDISNDPARTLGDPMPYREAMDTYDEWLTAGTGDEGYVLLAAWHSSNEPVTLIASQRTN